MDSIYVCFEFYTHRDLLLTRDLITRLGITSTELSIPCIIPVIYLNRTYILVISDRFVSSRVVLRVTKNFEFLAALITPANDSTKLQRKEKDSRNSSPSRRTFLGRVVRRGGCLDAAASIRYITGAFTSPHSPPPYASSLPLYNPLSLSLSLPSSLPQLRLDLVAVPPGWFLPCGRLCRHFPGGACAGPHASFSSRPPPRLCNYQKPLATPPPSRRTLPQRCNGHCLRVKSFHLLPRGTTLRPFAEERSFTRFSGLPIVAIECFQRQRGDALEKNVAYERDGCDDRGRLARIRVI